MLLQKLSQLCRRPELRNWLLFLERRCKCTFYGQETNCLTTRPLGGLKEFSTTMVTDINDLPATSPHGSDFRHHTQILGLASHPSDTRGTAAAHRTFSPSW